MIFILIQGWRSSYLVCSVICMVTEVCELVALGGYEVFTFYKRIYVMVIFRIFECALLL